MNITKATEGDFAVLDISYSILYRYGNQAPELLQIIKLLLCKNKLNAVLVTLNAAMDDGSYERVYNANSGSRFKIKGKFTLYPLASDSAPQFSPTRRPKAQRKKCKEAVILRIKLFYLIFNNLDFCVS